VTWTLTVTDLGGTPTVADLPWESLGFTHTLNGPGSAEIGCSMTKVDRADIEPGTHNYLIYQGATLRAAGRIWRARVDTNSDRQSVVLIGEGTAGVFSRRLVDWEARYEPIPEYPENINTVYDADTSQELILWDTIDRAQAETGGDLGISQGTHTGGTHLRRRWWCAEDGVFLADIFDDFASLSDGIDWAITPTLTDATPLTLATWNPSRGSDLSGSITLAGTEYLDTLSYEIDATQVVSRGRSVGTGDCEPVMGDETDAGALAAYGLIEDFEGSNSDQQDDADEVATGLLSPKALVGFDVWYELSNGPALGTYDVGDIIHLTSPRSGWGLDIDVKIQEVEVSAQIPDDDEHTFVRLNVSEV